MIANAVAAALGPLGVKLHELPLSPPRVWQAIQTRVLPHNRARNIGKSMQGRIWIGVLIGSTIGGLIPELWGGDMLSYSGVLLSAVGGFVGLWAGYKMS